jgi:hypothetical protein
MKAITPGRAAAAFSMRNVAAGACRKTPGRLMMNSFDPLTERSMSMDTPDADKLALSVIAAKARAFKDNPDKPECWIKDEAMMAQARLIWRLAYAVWMVGNIDTDHDKAQWWRDFDAVWNEAADIMRFNPPFPATENRLKASGSSQKCIQIRDGVEKALEAIRSSGVDYNARDIAELVVERLSPWLRHTADCLAQQDLNMDENLCVCGLMSTKCIQNSDKAPDKDRLSRSGNNFHEVGGSETEFPQVCVRNTLHSWDASGRVANAVLDTAWSLGVEMGAVEAEPIAKAALASMPASSSPRSGASEDEHDRLEAQYNAMKAERKAKDHADAFMQGWNRAKLHDSTLDKAFEAWRVCLKPDVPSVDVMLRKLAQIRKLALNCEGHSYDLIVALVDEALAGASQ